MPMTKRWAISSGSKYEELAGYSRAVIDGEWIFLSGTAGFDMASGSFPEDAGEQAVQALKTIGEALAKADAGFADVVRVRVYLADRRDVVAVSSLLRKTFADPRPTNTTIICGFADPAIKVELEITALRRR
jgi:enamine deaminase RidA (YjgF/YER057c/UK114 family)